MKFDRITAIRQHLFAHGHSTIAEIADAVEASEPTVRRDLVLLEGDGVIVRTHGGARIAENTSHEIGFESREQINLAAKRCIAEAAYRRLGPGMSVFLDAGTTVLQLARLIRLSPLELRVFTNCLSVAQHLMTVPEVNITLLGGILRPQNSSMVGPLAEEALSRLWFDTLFLGAGAVGPDCNIYSADPQEARINALMVERTDTSIVLADAEKFGARLTYRVLDVADVTAVISDHTLPAEWSRRLDDKNVQFELAGPL